MGKKSVSEGGPNRRLFLTFRQFLGMETVLEQDKSRACQDAATPPEAALGRELVVVEAQAPHGGRLLDVLLLWIAEPLQQGTPAL